MILPTILIGVILVLLLVWFGRQARRDVLEQTGPVDAAAAHWTAALAASRAQARTPHGRRTNAANTGFGGPSPFYSSLSWSYEAPADSTCSTDSGTPSDSGSSSDSACSSDSSSGRSD